MTGRELIEFIQYWKLEDCEVEVQYRDDGGCYFGTDAPMLQIAEAGISAKYDECKDYKRLIL